MLDVAAGNGNATLAAARRGADVTSTDYVRALLVAARWRAEAEGYRVHFEEADAENLPFADASFDAVPSTFGLMFTPDQERAAAEMLRVCRPGGRIGLANWTPESFVGRVFRILGRYVSPPPGVQSPALWGSLPRLEELFAGSAARLQATPRHFTFRYRSPMQWIELFRTCYGPMNVAYQQIDIDGQAALTADLLELLEQENRSGDSTLVLPSEYLEVVIEKRR